MSFRSALLLILGVFLLQFSRILFSGEVIFPHDNAREVGLPSRGAESRLANRYFSDESSVFVPELANNLRSDRKAWLATWNPSVQLGRPSFQGALSRAFPFTNLLSFVISDAFTLYTSLVLFTVFLTGLFCLLFLRSLDLHIAACAGAAIGLAFTTPVSYWLCFVMFVSAICWPMCLLWLVTEFTRRPSWPVAFGLVFATYCLLLGSYPQVTILSIYLIGPYALIRLWFAPGPNKEKLACLLALIGCAAAGLLASLPVFLDLFFTASNSARTGDVSDSFFLAVLPTIESAGELAGFLTNLFDWSWLGNAIDPKYPVPFNGVSFTPVYGTLIWLSFFLKNRRAVLLWQIFLALCVTGTLFPQVYLFAVHHLGFGLSRIQLAGGAIIPGFVLSAITMNAFLRGELRLSRGLAICSLAPIVVELLVMLLIWRQFTIHFVAIAITFFLIAALLCSLHWRWISLLLAVTVLSTFVYGRALLLSQPRHAIKTSSDLTEAIKAQTSNGERFAIASSPTDVLPSNEESLLGLTSINSYDSLSSRRYQALTRRWSLAGAAFYGKYFRFVIPRKLLIDSDFPLTNIRILLSSRPLANGGLTLTGEVNGIKVYKTFAVPISLLQTEHFQREENAAAIDPLAAKPGLRARILVALDDFLKVKVVPSPQETLLFLSQQYHRDWQAKTQRQSLSTVIVNNFYEGVILPPNTSEVSLSFRPFVLWSWLPQLLFAIGGASLLLRKILRMKDRPKIFGPVVTPTSNCCLS